MMASLTLDDRARALLEPVAPVLDESFRALRPAAPVFVTTRSLDGHALVDGDTV